MIDEGGRASPWGTRVSTDWMVRTASGRRVAPCRLEDGRAAGVRRSRRRVVCAGGRADDETGASPGLPSL